MQVLPVVNVYFNMSEPQILIGLGFFYMKTKKI